MRRRLAGVEQIVGEGKARRKRLKRWATAIAATTFACVVADYWLYPILAPIGGRSFDKGENGVWLRYTWYFGEKTSAEAESLGKELSARHVHYAYFHVRSVQPDGSLKFRFPIEARRLTGAFHRAAPGARAIAWIYIDAETVDLAKAPVRDRLAREAGLLTSAWGFDGVQLDYEPCSDGDRHFLDLLEETHVALPRGSVLSVAAECRYPGLLAKFGWSDEYIQEVAKRCDQLAVMCYDSGMILPRSYVWFVRCQAAVVPRLAKRANPACEVLLGLPTYGSGGTSHNPRAENHRLALKGVREARAAPEPDGVAVFADYTTSEADWREYEELWLRRTSP